MKILLVPKKIIAVPLESFGFHKNLVDSIKFGWIQKQSNRFNDNQTGCISNIEVPFKSCRFHENLADSTTNTKLVRFYNKSCRSNDDLRY